MQEYTMNKKTESYGQKLTKGKTTLIDYIQKIPKIENS